MQPTDLTIEILQGIRAEIRGTNAQLETLRTDLTARIDATNERLDATNERLDRTDRRQTESDMRVATELVALGGTLREMRDATARRARKGP
jgi:hypothetical protein